MSFIATRPGGAFRYIPRLYLADRNNNIGEELTEEGVEGTVTLDVDGLVSKWQLSVALKTYRRVLPLNEFVAPFLELVAEDGSYTSSQLGLYAAVPSDQTHMPSGSRSTIEGRDLCWLLDADISTEPITMASGANIINDAISDYEDGGWSRYNIPLSSQTSLKAVTWPAGTSRLQRLNERFMAAGYYASCPDRFGALFSMPYRDVAAAEPDVWYDDSYETQLIPVLNDSQDYALMCNRVVVIGTDPTSAPIVSIKENLDPTSPVSFENLMPPDGLVVGRREENPELQTQAAADAYAVELLRNGAAYYRRLEVYTLPDPERNPRDVYGFDVSNPDGVVADGKWLCSGYTVNLRANQPVMRHYVSRHEPFTVTTP